MAPCFRKPVSKIFVRMTSATGAVELALVDAAVSIQPWSVVGNGIPVLQRPTSTDKYLEDRQAERWTPSQAR